MSRLYPCVYYTEDGHCKKYSDDEVTSWCVQGPCEYETPSNADRLRRMTDEELAEIISSLGNCDTCYLYLNRGCNINTSCKDAVLEWLRKEADLKTIRKTEENADTFQQN